MDETERLRKPSFQLSPQVSEALRVANAGTNQTQKDAARWAQSAEIAMYSLDVVPGPQGGRYQPQVFNAGENAANRSFIDYSIQWVEAMQRQIAPQLATAGANAPIIERRLWDLWNLHQALRGEPVTQQGQLANREQAMAFLRQLEDESFRMLGKIHEHDYAADPNLPAPPIAAPGEMFQHLAERLVVSPAKEKGRGIIDNLRLNQKLKKLGKHASFGARHAVIMQHYQEIDQRERNRVDQREKGAERQEQVLIGERAKRDQQMCERMIVLLDQYQQGRVDQRELRTLNSWVNGKMNEKLSEAGLTIEQLTYSAETCLSPAFLSQVMSPTDGMRNIIQLVTLSLSTQRAAVYRRLNEVRNDQFLLSEYNNLTRLSADINSTNPAVRRAAFQTIGSRMQNIAREIHMGRNALELFDYAPGRQLFSRSDPGLIADAREWVEIQQRRAIQQLGQSAPKRI